MGAAGGFVGAATEVVISVDRPLLVHGDLCSCVVLWLLFIDGHAAPIH